MLPRLHALRPEVARNTIFHMIDLWNFEKPLPSRLTRAEVRNMPD